MSKIEVSLRVANALVRLMETVHSHGRDWKLLVAVLGTLTAFVNETPDEDPPERASSKSGSGNPKLRDEPLAHERRTNKERRGTLLSKRQKDRLRAVIDSLSDDEAAKHLDVGVQQVRRRASAGKLYTFIVGGKKRYSLWQFGDNFHVLPGLPETIEAIPPSWTPERVQRFMTAKQGPRLDGKRVSPVTWLARGCDPEAIRKLLTTTAD